MPTDHCNLEYSGSPWDLCCLDVIQHITTSMEFLFLVWLNVIVWTKNSWCCFKSFETLRQGWKMSRVGNDKKQESFSFLAHRGLRVIVTTRLISDLLVSYGVRISSHFSRSLCAERQRAEADFIHCVNSVDLRCCSLVAVHSLLTVLKHVFLFSKA